MKLFAPHLVDFYKTGHKFQYSEGTELVYSNFTPRSSRLANVLPDFDGKVVFCGLQGVIKWMLIDLWNETFFNIPKEVAVAKYKRRMDTSLGEGAVPVDHIAALHDLGYLPVRIKALKEGSRIRMRVPCWTIVNTKKEFFWVTNYLESQLSTECWKPIHTATIAYEYRRLLQRYATLTGSPLDFVPWQGHGFEFRGMSGVHDASQCGVAHLLSFLGTDTVSAIDYAEDYYGANADTKIIAGSVPACYDDQTDILTNRGFVPFRELLETDTVAQYHDDGTISFVSPSSRYVAPYKGEMIRFDSGSPARIDLLVTPNHRMVRRSISSGKIEISEARDATFSARNMWLQAGKKIGGTAELSMMDRLRIAFQADGSHPSREAAYTGSRTGTVPIRFSLKKDRKKERLETILRGLNIEFTRHADNNRAGYVNYWIPLPEKLSKTFDWVDLTDVNSEWCRAFIEEAAYWDACVKSNTVCYTSIDELNVSVFQAIAVMGGYRCGRQESLDPRGDRRLCYTATACRTKDHRQGEGIQKTTVLYDAMIYCVTVPTGMIIVRRNGCVSVSGNTEHSVMSMGGEESEIDTIRRIITKVYPAGVVSIVSDTWDFWEVITTIARKLKFEIMSRLPNALGLCKVVWRPDSGDPVKIICGDPEAEPGSPAFKGAAECLWEIFGGTITATGHKLLDSHVGLIYGDSITLQRAFNILEGLRQKGFASGNIVFGIGSFTYQMATRDSFGCAIKSTFGVVDGQDRILSKKPKTDDGIKNSATGLLRVELVDGEFVLFEMQSHEQEKQGELGDVFCDGKMIRDELYDDIRDRVLASLSVD